MTTEEIEQLALRIGSETHDFRIAFTLPQLRSFVTEVRRGTFQELHPFAVGPDEHLQIDYARAEPFDSLVGRPVAVRIPPAEMVEAIASVAIPVPPPEMVEAMGMEEASRETMRRAQAVERAVWRKNRLRFPD